MGRFRQYISGQRLLIIKERGDMAVHSMLLMIAFLLLGLLMIWYVLQMRELHMIKNVLNDGLTITNLSSPLSDEEQMQQVEFAWFQYDASLGAFVVRPSAASEIYPILDYEKTYGNFLELIEENLMGELYAVSNENGESRIQDYKMEQLAIYNVSKDRTQVSIYDETGLVSLDTYENRYGMQLAPDGSEVTRTSVYSRITFSYQDLLGRVHENLKIEQLTAVRATY